MGVDIRTALAVPAVSLSEKSAVFRPIALSSDETFCFREGQLQILKALVC